jgi:hypothetical protein
MLKRASMAPAPERRGALRYENKAIDSGAEVVGFPGFDELFDGGTLRQLFLEDAAAESWKFGIAGETERDELVDGKFGYERLEIGRQDAFEAEAHFEADDAVLHGERKDAGVEGNEKESDGEQEGDDIVKRNA